MLTISQNLNKSSLEAYLQTYKRENQDKQTI